MGRSLPTLLKMLLQVWETHRKSVNEAVMKKEYEEYAF
jgi:hypothetical protein